MNWIWSLRSNDGGMNGLEFSLAYTAGGHRRALVHAAPSTLKVEVRTEEGELVAAGVAEREGEYSPITLLALDPEGVTRQEIWPTPDHFGMPVLLPGGEVGVLTAWSNAEDRSWWKWSIELSNHKDRPADWSPPAD